MTDKVVLEAVELLFPVEEELEVEVWFEAAWVIEKERLVDVSEVVVPCVATADTVWSPLPIFEAETAIFQRPSGPEVVFSVIAAELMVTVTEASGSV